MNWNNYRRCEFCKVVNGQIFRCHASTNTNLDEPNDAPLLANPPAPFCSVHRGKANLSAQQLRTVGIGGANVPGFRRCRGMSQANHRCVWNSNSTKYPAGPLRRGHQFCVFHTLGEKNKLMGYHVQVIQPVRAPPVVQNRNVRQANAAPAPAERNPRRSLRLSARSAAGKSKRGKRRRR